MCVLVASDSALDRLCRRVFQISCWNRWMVLASVTNSASRDRRAREIHPASSTFPPWPLTANTARSCSLSRAYLLKEQLRAVFAVKGQGGKVLLAGWISRARRSRLAEFVTLARTIQRFQQLIWNTLRHNLSNALSEATNTHIRA